MSDTETEFDPFEEEQANDDTTQDDNTSQGDGEGNQSDDEPTGEADEGADNQGDGEPAGEPADGDQKGTKTEKMIPESRLKAALKDVTEERDRLATENTQLKSKPAAPIPDRASDPDGYDRHVRLETSKKIMSATHDDYNETIMHFQEMAKANPHLNEIVGGHEMPAKFAYDLAKRDMEIRELSGLKSSDEWTQFQEWKKTQGQGQGQQVNLQQPKPKNDVASKLPTNLNRATSASNLRTNNTSDDDDLFKGAL